MTLRSWQLRKTRCENGTTPRAKSSIQDSAAFHRNPLAGAGVRYTAAFVVGGVEPHHAQS